MKKVGLVTYYNNNYGSILQCFASKRFIESLGYECHVLYETSHFSFIRRIKRYFWLLSRIIKTPSYLRVRRQMKVAMRAESLILSPKSQILMNDFVSTYISPRGFSWEELCRIGKASEYVCFVTGSDQVWNASRDIADIFFLRFCPIKKRIALAVSFGVKTIPTFNSHIIKYIREFKELSVREENAFSIVSAITTKKVRRIADPALLFSREDWLSLFQTNRPKENDIYILLHFLNEPNSIALTNILEYSNKNHAKILVVGYKHIQFDNQKNMKFVDASPIDYLNLIDGSLAIFTDSFHTTLFAINFGKCFFTYERQYLHNYSQSSRIVELLERFNLESRLINSMGKYEEVPDNYEIDESILQSERTKTRAFLNMVLTGFEDGSK